MKEHKSKAPACAFVRDQATVRKGGLARRSEAIPTTQNPKLWGEYKKARGQKGKAKPTLR